MTHPWCRTLMRALHRFQPVLRHEFLDLERFRATGERSTTQAVRLELAEEEDRSLSGANIASLKNDRHDDLVVLMNKLERHPIDCRFQLSLRKRSEFMRQRFEYVDW